MSSLDMPKKAERDYQVDAVTNVTTCVSVCHYLFHCECSVLLFTLEHIKQIYAIKTGENYSSASEWVEHDCA